MREMVKKHEGFSNRLYRDSLGNLTGGYGHYFKYGSTLPKEIWEAIFEYDYHEAEIDYALLNVDLDPVREAVVIDMLFNLGLPKFLKFKNTLEAIRAGDWEAAAQGMERSKWYQQVRIRAVELVKMMRTGEYA